MYRGNNDERESMAAQLGRLTRFVLQFSLFLFLTVKLSDFNSARFYPHNDWEILCVVIVSVGQAFFYVRNVFRGISWIYNNADEVAWYCNKIFSELVWGITQERKDDLKMRR